MTQLWSSTAQKPNLGGPRIRIGVVHPFQPWLKVPSGTAELIYPKPPEPQPPRHTMIIAPSLPFSRSSFGIHVQDRPVPSPLAVSVRAPRAAYAAEEESQNTSYYTATSIPMAAAASVPSLYEILGTHSAASGQEIKAAYRRLARECHPDMVAVDRKDISADQFKRVRAAYATLSDPEKRADYDRGLLLKASNRRVMYRSSSYPSSSSSGFTLRRNWETDQCW